MNAPAPLVLVVEDEAPGSGAARANAREPTRFPHRSRPATAEEGLAAATTRAQPDIDVLLDLGLPDLDGIELTKKLREWSATPVLVLSARGREQDKIDALDAGADDYLPEAVRRRTSFLRASASRSARAAARRRRARLRGR